MPFGDAGPSRSVPPPQPRREGPWNSRRDEDRDREDGRPRLSEPLSSRPSPGGNWSRPSSRSYRPTPPAGGGARNLTPSPPRRHDIDRDRERDRDRFGPGPISDRRGPGLGPGPGFRDNRRWDRDRERHDDRFRADYSPPRSRRISPPTSLGSGGGGRPHSPPRGPRALLSNNPPPLVNRIAPSAMVPGRGPPPRNGNGPTVVPRGPRSMRGSSSPVELRHQLSELPGPSSVPSRTVDLPVDSKPVFSPEDGEDLEEGEVISPVRRPLPVETTGLPRGPGDRWTPSDRRRSVSPRKPLFRSRPVSPDYRDRDRIGSRDRNWDRDRDRDRERDGRPRDRRFDLQQQQRRSLSPEIIRPKFERHDSAGIPGGRHLDRSPAVSTDPAGGSAGTSGVLSAPTPPAPSVAPPAHSHSPPRPSTPPIPSPVDRTAAVQDTAIINVGSTPAPARPDTPLLPDIPAAPPPSTSPLTVLDTSPAVPTHTPATEGSTIERPRTPELPETAPTVDETPDRQEEQEQGESQGPLKNEEQEVAQRTSVVTAAAKTGLFSSSTLTTLPDSHETVRGPASDTSSASTPKRAPTPPLHVRVRSNLVYGEPSSSNVALDQPRDEAHASTGKQVADEGARNGTDGVNASVQFAELPTNLSPTSLRVTIAERRSVKLPDTAVPLSSPFGERIRKDSMPTAGSAHTSTDAETDDGLRTADIRDEPHSADLSDGALEALFEKQVAAAVEAQLDDWQADFDPDVVYAWNLKVADSPPPSPRAWDLQDRIDRVTWDMDATHDHVAKLVSIKVERDEAEAAEHIQTLQAQYRDLHQQWQAQCDILKAQMSKRAPLPAVWSALPGDPLVDLPSQQPTTPGLLPGTLAFDDTRARVNRRRGGVADVVNSDEELNQAIARSLREDELNPITLAHKTLATVPDMLPEAERRVRYDDENDLVKDPLVFYDFAGTQGPIWTAEEREVFRRAYPNSAKQFGKIANKLPNKTVADCVQYYYRTKKELDWKSQARRGGDRRRNRAPVVKKPGKSSALMADLGRQKPTINPNARGPGAGAGVGGKTTVTPGRPGKGRVSAIAGAGAAATPSDPAGSKRRKPTVDAATIDGVSSEAPSRAGSEVPGTAAKAKMRMSIKGKRPRQSSMTGLTSTDPLALAAAANPAFATPAMASDGAAPAPPTDGSSSSNPQAELLPPAKRAGKRRKVVGADGASAADSPGVPGLNGTGTANGTGEKTDKPRRSATNSYWSVDEKKLVLRLFAEYGDDTERIATHIAGKSVRQVQNFLATRSADPSAFAAAVGAVAGGDGPTTAYPAGYDVYTAADRKPQQQQQQQPRLGTFSSAQNQAASPTKAFSRPGGMRISALLNDDAVSEATKLEALDAASDGTVEDEGMARPTQRRPSDSAPPPPDLDKYKSRPYESAFLPSSSSSYPAPHGYTVQHPHPPLPAARSWDYPHQNHGYPHQPHQQHQHQQRPPQMGLFGPPQGQGRTIYDSSRERPLPPPRDRGRSDGPAFTGFPPVNARPPPPHPGQQ